MRLVVIESPYAGDVERNLRYLRAAMADCLHRGEAPYASHALYTQPGVLNDNVPGERKLGIEAGYEWWRVADAIVFYTDLGWSGGMLRARDRYLLLSKACPSCIEHGWPAERCEDRKLRAAFEERLLMGEWSR